MHNLRLVDAFRCDRFSSRVADSESSNYTLFRCSQTMSPQRRTRTITTEIRTEHGKTRVKSTADGTQTHKFRHLDADKILYDTDSVELLSSSPKAGRSIERLFSDWFPSIETKIDQSGSARKPFRAASRRGQRCEIEPGIDVQLAGVPDTDVEAPSTSQQASRQGRINCIAIERSAR